jgi:hypothetical protein
MNYFDDENNIIEHFQEVECSSVFIPIESEETIYSFENVHDKSKWKKWTNSSGKSDPPPDFYCDEFRCMMDVMRVDDHSFEYRKGKFVNPTNSRESEIQAELRKNEMEAIFPNAKTIVNAITKLPTQEDHNYTFYRNNFVRTVEQHKTKIKQYRNNHQDYKLIFFVIDESSGYIQTSDEPALKSNTSSGKSMIGTPHLHFRDEDFITSLIGADIDYLIWFTPNKMISTENNLLDLPKVCIFDIKTMNIETIKYDENLMVSSEE